MTDLLTPWGDAARTAAGFFWKAGWAFVMGYAVSGMIQAFVPKARLTRHMGDTGAKSVSLPGWLVVLENAAVAPFVAAATFIGSMGNIPLATVLDANGVLFAGIMGFIYSDLMVPPLVAINAKYYGKRVALYIAAVMWLSIVITAVVLHGLFGLIGITPESGRAVDEVSQFAIDYTFWLNLAMVIVAAVMVWLHRQHVRQHIEGGMDHGGGGGVKRVVVYLMIAIVVGGLGSWAWTTL